MERGGPGWWEGGRRFVLMSHEEDEWSWVGTDWPAAATPGFPQNRSQTLLLSQSVSLYVTSVIILTLTLSTRTGRVY